MLSEEPVAEVPTAVEENASEPGLPRWPEAARALLAAGLATLAVLGLLRGFSAAAYSWETDAQYYYSYSLLHLPRAGATPPQLAERMRETFPELEVRLLRGGDAIHLRGPRRAFDFARQSDLLLRHGFDPQVYAAGRFVPLTEAWELPEQPWRELPLLLADCFALLVGAGLCRLLDGASLPWSLGGGAKAWAAGGSVAVALTLSNVVLGGFLAALGWPFDVDLWMEDIQRTGGATLAAATLGIVVASPIAEELFFRGWMLPHLESKAGPAVALLGSSLLFALYHENPSGIPLYFVSGVFFGEAARRSGGLLVPIVAHGAYNALTLL